MAALFFLRRSTVNRRHALPRGLALAVSLVLAACISPPRQDQSADSQATAETRAAPARAAGTSATEPPEPDQDFGLRWVREAAEYEAVALQAYAAATEDLPRLLADESWSALPQPPGGPQVREVAIIFDIDETVVNNVEFQAQLEPPFSEAKFDTWHEANSSAAVPGAAAFAQRARAAGVKLFFITNRSCVPAAGGDACPQKRIALDDLREAGIEADPREVLLSNEEPGWTQEKQVRRNHVAAKHRVIMLFGDDLGDFLPCVRRRVYAPCTQPGTRASRLQQTQASGRFWGEGWYVLPNPMYGSWTSAQ